MDNFYLTVTAGLLWVFLISMSFQLLVAEVKPMRVKHYEVCRALRLTLYPYEVNQTEWRSCMEVGHGEN